jgi:hypothetical protein
MVLHQASYDVHIRFTDDKGTVKLARIGYDYEYLVDYHPKRKGNNPLFDNNSQLILDFKEGYEAAIDHFAGLILQDFNPGWNGCCCVAVPSHDPANNYSPPKDFGGKHLSAFEMLILGEPKQSSAYDLIARLAGEHKRLQNGSAVLVRTQKVEKKSLGGSRDIITDINSITINKDCGIDISGKNVLLIDDVITTGHSIAACKLILEAGGASKVFVLCLGKTARDPYVPKSPGGSQPTTADVPFDEEVPF